MNHCRYSNGFHSIPQVYSGTKYDILFLMGKSGCLWPTGEELLVNIPLIMVYYPLYVIDLPLSLVCDTVLLPYTAYKQIRYGDLVDPPYIRMGERYEKEKDYEKAIATYQRFLKVLPKYNTHDRYSYDDINIYSHIAWLYGENGNYKDAISYYEQALDFTVKDDRRRSIEKAVYINRNLADLYLKTGDYEKAIARCNQALKHVNNVRSVTFRQSLESLMNKIAEKKYSGLNRDLLLAWNRNGPYPVLLLVVDNFTSDKTYRIENAYFEHMGESYRFMGETISYPIVLEV